MLINVLGIVCGLAVVVFAALEPGRPRAVALFAAGLIAASVAIGPARVPDPVWAGAFIALASGLALWKPRGKTASDPLFPISVTLACGGAMAAVWVAVLAAQGLPRPLGYVLVGTCAGVSYALAARRPGFAPASLREEALVLVGTLGAVLAAAPAIVAGWDSAAALRGAPLAQPDVSTEAWAFVLAAAAVVLGVIHALWRRR